MSTQEAGEMRLELARAILARRLSLARKEWRNEGANILGPAALAAMVEDLHRLEPQHIDIGFVLNREDDNVPVIWDSQQELEQQMNKS